MKPLDSYQGEVDDKAGIHARFRAKVAVARADPTVAAAQDWSGMDVLLEELVLMDNDRCPGRGKARRPVTIPLWSRWLSKSGQELPVLLASRHGVDDHLIATLEGQDDRFEQMRPGVEAEA